MQGEKDFVVYFSLEKLDLLRKYCTKRLYDIQVNEIENSDGFDIVTDNVRKTNYTEQSMVVRKDSGFYQVNFNAEAKWSLPFKERIISGRSFSLFVP